LIFVDANTRVRQLGHLLQVRVHAGEWSRMVASLDVCFRAWATYPHPHHLPGIPRRAAGMLRYLEAVVVLLSDGHELKGRYDSKSF